MTQKNLPLGRGLAALLGDIKLSAPDDASPTQITMLDINQIVSGTFQPRKHFDEQAIEELAASIKKHGLIQPITVRPKDDHYEIIAGERRWRACQKIAKSPVPVIIQHVSDENALAIALIENLQRKELNSIEEAQALHRLIDEFELTHLQIAEILGQSRAHVSNQLRLLQLEPEVQNLLAKEFITPGHARCLIGLDTNTQINIAEKIHQQQWSVRTTEKYLQQLLQPKPDNKNALSTLSHQNILKKLQKIWPAQFQIKTKSDDTGKIIINYHSANDLTKLLEHLLKENEKII
jgi:ParB family chromosome partitioning protein